MSGEVNVGTGGAKQFYDLSRDLKRVGAKGLQKRLYRALYKSTEPAITAARKSALKNLPGGGGRGKRKTRLVRTGTKMIEGKAYITRKRVKTGTVSDGLSLAQRVSEAKFSARAIRGKNVGIRVTATAAGRKKVDLEALDRGNVRHPLFGLRTSKSGKDVWFDQPVKPGWFTKPMEDNSGNVERELKKAVADIEKNISGK